LDWQRTDGLHLRLRQQYPATLCGPNRDFDDRPRSLSWLFLEMLVAAHDAGHLQFFGDHVRLADKAAFDAYLTPLREIDRVVYAKEPFAGPKQVLRYLSRYTHRIAISNRRLLSADENDATFTYNDYRIEGPGRS